jgi:predicted GNAT family acetyltransferase
MTTICHELLRRAGPCDRFDLVEDRIRIRPAPNAEYDRLAHLHYRAGPPATRVLTLAAYDTRERDPVGVLVVSMPVLNAPWREAPWPGRFTGRSKRDNARRINRTLRTISRVIIDPRWRAVGLARSLVRAYLNAPLTEFTEARAAMGPCCPFFRAAGMQEFDVPPSAADARLRAILQAMEIEAWRLADPAFTPTVAGASVTLEREIRRWAGASRRLRARAAEPIERLLPLVPVALLSDS